MENSRYASRLRPASTVSASASSLVSKSNELEPDLPEFSSDTPPLERFPRDLPQEAEDAHITGGTRSLSRRLLALNVPILETTRESSRKIELLVRSPKPRQVKAAT